MENIKNERIERIVGNPIVLRGEIKKGDILFYDGEKYTNINLEECVRNIMSK